MRFSISHLAALAGKSESTVRNVAATLGATPHLGLQLGDAIAVRIADRLMKRGMRLGPACAAALAILPILKQLLLNEDDEAFVFVDVNAATSDVAMTIARTPIEASAISETVHAASATFVHGRLMLRGILQELEGESLEELANAKAAGNA